MENVGALLLVVAAVLALGLLGASGGWIGLKRQDRKDWKAADKLTGTVERVWAGLTSAQQVELASLHSLVMQEEWVEKQVDPALRVGVSAERILIELANRGHVPLGEGTFMRHASPLDFIKANAPAHPTTGPESIAPMPQKSA